MIDYYEPNIDLILLGCGFVGCYHLGAIHLLMQVWPHKPFSRLSGASCGGLLGSLLMVGVPTHQALRQFMHFVKQFRKFLWNPIRMASAQKLVEQCLDRLLPPNAHQICSGRLGISLTRLWSMDNKFVSYFESRKDLIDAISCGCFIPLWSGSLTGPTYKGEKCIDGAASNNVPQFKLKADELLKGRRQIRISGFCTDLDISPKAKYSFGRKHFFGTNYDVCWDNIERVFYAMLPLAGEGYRTFFLSGYQDMKDYLFRNRMILCRQCYREKANCAPLILWDNNCGDEKSSEKKGCLMCLRLLERVDSLRLPLDALEALEG